jgi:hypothetical protein
MLAQVSPYGQTYTPMYEYWAGDGARTPAMLSTEAISSKVQWFLALHSGIQSYITLHDPFVYPTAPGLNHPCSNQTIWVINDVVRSDASLSLVDQPANLFHIAGGTSVPSDLDFSAAMALATQGQSEIPPEADPAATGWTQLGNHLRRCHPLPHKYIVRTLMLVQGGLADHKTMWKGLASDILLEPAVGSTPLTAGFSQIDGYEAPSDCRTNRGSSRRNTVTILGHLCGRYHSVSDGADQDGQVAWSRTHCGSHCAACNSPTIPNGLFPGPGGRQGQV